jgi:hypothetical protein
LYGGTNTQEEGTASTIWIEEGEKIMKMNKTFPYHSEFGGRPGGEKAAAEINFGSIYRKYIG